MSERLYIVIPCYNEQEVLPEASVRLGEKLSGLIRAGAVSENSRVLFVDDGSTDNTWSIISQLHERDKAFSGVKLSKNRGHQNALLAGLMSAMERADITVSMDADLQDDIGVLDGFLQKRAEGCEIVYGVRGNRDSDGTFKRGSAQGFYKLMNALGVELVYNHADCRLMSRRALEGLAKFGEVNLFLRGIVPLIGYKTGAVTYSRAQRFAGESKYPLKKMLALAFDGVTSFSVKPIRMLAALGLIIMAASAAISLYSVLARLLDWKLFPGWSALMCSIWFLGGTQLAALGLIGSYIGKIYGEVKSRPRYIIETILDK